MFKINLKPFLFLQNLPHTSANSHRQGRVSQSKKGLNQFFGLKPFLFILLLSLVMSTNVFAVSKDAKWCALKSNTVNVRTGPGKRYPIKWVYKRRDMPLKVTANYEEWVKIEDFEGTTGWVHPSMVSEKHTFIVNDEYVYLKKDSKKDSSYIAKLEEGVIGEMITCEEDLCKVSIGSWEGFIAKDRIWGCKTNEK